VGRAGRRIESVAEERLTFLSLRAVSRTHLFDAARSLIGTAEPRGPALVVAQAAVEVGVETAIDFALQLHEVSDPVREWIGTSAIRSWSPNNERVRHLWTALTGDKLSQAPSWAAYKEGLKRRDAFVHRTAGVSEQEAESFITAAEQLLAHIVDVMTEAFPSPYGT
jgi:hypothetical protein